MLLHPDPSLAEVPGFTREQLDALARSVELRRQQLEQDIAAYISRRQEDLRRHEQQLLAHHRSMGREQDAGSADKTPSSHADTTSLPASASASAEPPSPSPTAARKHEPGEKAKRTKHTRQQKREKELYGLVTPVFLPLLDARDTSPKHAQQPPTHAQRTEDAAHPAAAPAHASPASDAQRSNEGRKARSREHTDMAGGGGGSGGTAAGDPVSSHSSDSTPRKAKRSAVKKSALRQHNPAARSRRKRVSLVIDGQTVLPADTVAEPALTSPSSEATSASNSTASLDDMIDPRLTRAEPPAYEHHDAIHHSLPLPMSNNVHSPTKPIVDTPSSLTLDSTRPPTTTTPTYAYNPPSTATRTFLDPSPTNQPLSLPRTAGPDPIYASSPSLDAGKVAANTPAQGFNTYVGGLHGSGTDDVDQAGSYGYPSSLGASYLESYMQSRPLRVRMEAADKAGLDEEEKRRLARVGKEKEKERDEGVMEMELDDEEDVKRRSVAGGDDADEDMDIMGEMEGF